MSLNHYAPFDKSVEFNSQNVVLTINGVNVPAKAYRYTIGSETLVNIEVTSDYIIALTTPLSQIPIQVSGDTTALTPSVRRRNLIFMKEVGPSNEITSLCSFEIDTDLTSWAIDRAALQQFGAGNWYFAPCVISYIV